MDPIWIVRLNAVLASVAVTLGFWILWGTSPVLLTAALAVAVTAFFLWQSRSAGEVWAWATLMLGLESLAWPIVTMVQLRFSSAQPTDEQMGLILTAVLFGMFSSIFWMTFSYGLFKWVRRKATDAETAKPPGKL